MVTRNRETGVHTAIAVPTLRRKYIMKKFTSTALALVLGTALHANATETPNFALEVIEDMEMAIAVDKKHDVTFSFGYDSLEEENCSNLVFAIYSWFPLSDVEEKTVYTEAGFKVGENEGRIENMKGALMHVEDKDLYLYQLYPYTEFVSELIDGETMMYIDQTYSEGTFTVIDLSDLPVTLARVMAGCLDRGGEFEDAAPVNNSPKTRI